MNKLKLLFLCLILQSSFGFSQVGIGVLGLPQGNRYDDIYFINADTGWAAGGVNKSIYKTTNGGLTWQFQYNANSYLRTIEFMDENVGICASTFTKIYRTTNGGANWLDITATIPFTLNGTCGLSNPPGTDDFFGCGKWSGNPNIIKSTDAGLTWIYDSMHTQASALVDILFINKDTGFVTGRDTGMGCGIILKTINGGVTWYQVHCTNLINSLIWKIQYLNATHMYASIQDDYFLHRILKSSDMGETWNQVIIDSNNFYNITRLQMIGFLDSLQGFAGGWGPGLYLTEDGGNSWELDSTIGYSFNRFFRINNDLAYMSAYTGYKVVRGGNNVFGMNDEELVMDSIDIYPNPANDILHVHLNLPVHSEFEMAIVDMNGKTVFYRITDYLEPGSYDFEFDVSAFPPGIYYLNTQSNLAILRKKFIKL